MRTSDSLNIPLKADIDEALRRRACKDEQFRQALIADPKAVIEREFPECFEDGKAPDYLTYKVLEEDTTTRYIILPTIADQFSKAETSSEVIRELVMNSTSTDIYIDCTPPTVYGSSCVAGYCGS